MKSIQILTAEIAGFDAFRCLGVTGRDSATDHGATSVDAPTTVLHRSGGCLG